MAEGKKSFVLYCDLIGVIDHLTTLEKGKLFEHLLDYVNDKNPILEDRILLGTWKHIEQSLKRDLIKYEKRAVRSRENGALGGRPPKINKPSGLIDNPEEPRKPVSVSDTVTVTVTDSVNDILLEKETKELFKTWLDYRKEIKKPIKSDKTKIALANKILKEGFKKSSEIINNSIECGYQGLFWDKFTPQNKQPLSQMDSGVRKKLEKYG